jgi:hypothetical protein
MTMIDEVLVVIRKITATHKTVKASELVDSFKGVYTAKQIYGVIESCKHRKILTRVSKGTYKITDKGIWVFEQQSVQPKVKSPDKKERQEFLDTLTLDHLDITELDPIGITFDGDMLLIGNSGRLFRSRFPGGTDG